jgi:hypothetical protein
MTLLTLFLLGLIAVFIAIGIDLNKQLRAYEQHEKERRKTISQASSAAKTSNKMDQKRPSGKSKGSRNKRKKDIE